MGSCSQPAEERNSQSSEATPGPGQSAVVDNESQRNVVQIAAGSPDHSTLVAGVKAAGLVDALSNAGPFTVFAPVNAAFDALPAGTVDDLLKPENKSKLSTILEHHVAVGVYKAEDLRDGQSLGMVDGTNVTFSVKDDKVRIEDAEILTSISAANGLIHVIDKVILPK